MHPDANIRGLCFFLCLGILHQILQWYLRTGAKVSPHQTAPFQILHVPNPPPPPPQRYRGWAVELFHKRVDVWVGLARGLIQM